MNENKKLINIRLTPKEKTQMEKLAETCGLSLSEYLRKRGLGYEPRPLLDVSFYQLYTQLCDLCNQPISADVEVALLNLITDIRRELLLPKQETRKEIKRDPTKPDLWGEEDPRSADHLPLAANGKDGG
jgi:hypothetical protein